MITTEAKVLFDSNSGHLSGKEVGYSLRKLGDLKGVFADEASFKDKNPDTLVYKVQVYLPVDEGTEGGLFFGTTIIFPGMVGNEYFMTKGHFHTQTDRAEFYWCLQGKGMLLFMDENRNTRAEIMKPGSLHYIPGKIAHRVADTGSGPLHFSACWPSDAGHDYATIAAQGFSARLLEVEGKPELVKSND